MWNGLERRIGRTEEAYCFETDSILDPYLALANESRHGELHYYCGTVGCGWKLSGGVRHEEHPPKYEIAWFVGKRIPPELTHSHSASCPFKEAKRVSIHGGQSAPTKQPAIPAKPFIPDHIEDPAGIRLQRWPLRALSDAAVLAYVTNAKAKFAGGPPAGTIEEVADAERILAKNFSDFLVRKKSDPELQPPKDGKPNRDLWISGIKKNYLDGFVSPEEALGQIGNIDFRDEHIVHFQADVQLAPGNGNGFLLNSVGQVMSIWVDPTICRRIASKGYLQGLLGSRLKDNKRVHCYLWKTQATLQNGIAFLHINTARMFDFVAFR